MTGHVDLICFSHLRWDHEFQRPQQLLSRAARDRRVYYIEEPTYAGTAPRLSLHPTLEGVIVVRLTLPEAITDDAMPGFLRDLVDELRAEGALDTYVLWCSTPKAMAFARDLQPLAVVYDQLDDALADDGDAADLVFTPDPDVYESGERRSRNHHAFPGGADIAHFAKARQPHPPIGHLHAGTRVGCFGVFDDRIDLALVGALAELRPDLQLVMIGPATDVLAARLPHRRNLHWLGPRPYEDLPAHLAGWDVALLPLVRHGSRPHNFLRVPEYLAAGLPVVATGVPEVVEPYRALELVRVADTADDLARAIDAALREDKHVRLARADRWLGTIAWDKTWQGMDALITAAIAARAEHRPGESR